MKAPCNRRPLLAVALMLALGSGSALAAPPKSRPAFTDPVAYCRAVGTVDRPDRRYRGPKDPPSVMRAVGASADEEGVAWRCYRGRLLACDGTGTTGPCDQVDVSRRPAAPMREYCQGNPGSGFIPAYAAGHYTAYAWYCAGRAPAIARQITKADGRGFNPDGWTVVGPATGRAHSR